MMVVMTNIILLFIVFGCILHSAVSIYGIKQYCNLTLSSCTFMHLHKISTYRGWYNAILFPKAFNCLPSSFLFLLLATEANLLPLPPITNFEMLRCKLQTMFYPATSYLQRLSVGEGWEQTALMVLSMEDLPHTISSTV